MKSPTLLKICAALCAAYSAGATAVEPLADVVVITASRIEHASFELPAAIDVIDSSRIRDAQLRVNASESLVAVPGLVVQNRQNYAQDLQISSRGFGARSAFGVRGVRLIADGIPATMPDGQGQAATFNLDRAQRIEVLRGPFSALYGNHSGGVVQLFTEDGREPASAEMSVMAGSDGQRKVDLSTQGRDGKIGYVVDVSRFETDGYRDHSAARRDQQFAKLTVTPDSRSKLTLVASSLRQKDTEDPLGVQWATYERDPRAGEIDPTDTETPKRTYAERYNTRKSIDHQQAGASYDIYFGENRLHLMAYGGNREVVQYQAFSRGFQAPATHSGGVIDFDRNFHGVAINWTDVRRFNQGVLRTTAGLDYDRSTDDRKGYENFAGTQLGVKGALRRDEEDVVSNVDPYVQTEWQSGPWRLTAGVRHSRVKVEVEDRFVGNGNDSGDLTFTRTTPVVGALYKVTPDLNVYVSAARGFETPTLNELFYSGAGDGFNYGLRPARSVHVEAGTKIRLTGNTRVDAALFEVRTRDEVVVDTSSGGRTSYRNASKTLRQGIEVSVDSSWTGGFSARAALTGLRAVYDQAFGNVDKGSRLPGVARTTAYGELAWKDDAGRYGAAIEALANGKVYAEDTNREKAAPGYGLLNLRFTAMQPLGGWRLKEFVRLNNLLDKDYVGSVIVGDANKRYYEAAPGRNWQAGFSAQYLF
ncbi:TonB-dependent receptor family protein [Pseudoduganella umbonata]|uniref:Iron complex outermembrane receptor protein n=1 Tax=Pseudoduganella umbonata TaxID=864828 RepID=A0A4P8HQY5_9BURK|nr:TonB-dependent receptor [Pseudoduganella umbonata]MBB3225394.1 iron complex outermembrane receptor protein [Pseudoduganella umbonata]QCP12229.1 TonB-dependent receptor [Pseudoduganella umbonata]